MAKRVKYSSRKELESSEESDSNNYGESSDPEIDIQKYRSARKPKCFSKNAEMARRNRLKKKIHLAKLEKEVGCLKKAKVDLTSIIDRQSFMISDLKREVRYLKGILANSSDICTLIKNIHASTGKPVSSSLNNSLKVCTVSSEENDNLFMNESMCDSSLTGTSNFNDYYLSSNGLLNDTDIYQYVNTSRTTKFSEQIERVSNLSEEHNYTNNSFDDYGICLHVCKNKVSLELCSTCEENARSHSS